jgi:hypothetical protein
MPGLSKPDQSFGASAGRCASVVVGSGFVIGDSNAQVEHPSPVPIGDATFSHVRD